MARIDTIRVTKQADVEVELAKRSRNKQLREAVSMSERHAPFSSQGENISCSPIYDTKMAAHIAAMNGMTWEPARAPLVSILRHAPAAAIPDSTHARSTTDLRGCMILWHVCQYVVLRGH